MKTNKDVKFMRKMLLKIITRLQEFVWYRVWNTPYYFLTKLHFKIFFGKNLVTEAVENSREFRLAQKRHVEMTLAALYDHKIDNPVIERAIASSFQKNLLLEAKL